MSSQTLPIVVVIVAVFEGTILTHGLGPRERRDWNDVKISKVPTETTGWHDNYSLPGATAELADGGVLRTDGEFSLFAHLVETGLWCVCVCVCVRVHACVHVCVHYVQHIVCMHALNTHMCVCTCVCVVGDHEKYTEVHRREHHNKQIHT